MGQLMIICTKDDFRAAVESAVRRAAEGGDDISMFVEEIVAAAEEYAPIYVAETAEPPCYGPCCGGDI